MTKYFRINRERSDTQSAGPLSAKLDEQPALTSAGNRMKRNGGGPYRLFNFHEGKWSAPMSHRGCLGGLKHRLESDRIGDAERILCGNGNVIRVRRVGPPEIHGPYDREQLRPLVRQFYDVAATLDPEGEYWGGYVCRRATHNWNVWSQHAYGAAIDWAPSSKAKGIQIRNELQGRFGGQVTVVYLTTNHWDHGHYELRPQATGAPCGR